MLVKKNKSNRIFRDQTAPCVFGERKMIPEKSEIVETVQAGFNEDFCEECGAYMKEVYHAHESGKLYVWFECTNGTCSGQLLRQMPLTSNTQV